MTDPITHATEHPPAKRCPICRGRGALRCDCWPGDCICGFDDEPCDNCDGTGWLYPDDYEERTMNDLPRYALSARQPCCTAFDEAGQLPGVAG